MPRSAAPPPAESTPRLRPAVPAVFPSLVSSRGRSSAEHSNRGSGHRQISDDYGPGHGMATEQGPSEAPSLLDDHLRAERWLGSHRISRRACTSCSASIGHRAVLDRPTRPPGLKRLIRSYSNWRSEQHYAFPTGSLLRDGGDDCHGSQRRNGVNEDARRPGRAAQSAGRAVPAGDATGHCPGRRAKRPTDETLTSSCRRLVEAT